MGARRPSASVHEVQVRKLLADTTICQEREVHQMRDLHREQMDPWRKILVGHEESEQGIRPDNFTAPEIR